MKRFAVFFLMSAAAIGADQPAVSFQAVHYNKTLLAALSRGLPVGVMPKIEENLMVFVRIADPAVSVFQLSVRYTDTFGTQRTASRSCDRDPRPNFVSGCTVFFNSTKVNSVTVTPMLPMESHAVTQDQ